MAINMLQQLGVSYDSSHCLELPSTFTSSFGDECSKFTQEISFGKMLFPELCPPLPTTVTNCFVANLSISFPDPPIHLHTHAYTLTNTNTCTLYLKIPPKNTMSNSIFLSYVTAWVRCSLSVCWMNYSAVFYFWYKLMAHINSRRCADILVILTEIKKYVSSEVFMKRTIYLRFASKESTFWGGRGGGRNCRYW